MSFLFGMSLRGFSSLHCSLPYIQSWGMLLQRGCIYKLEFYRCKIILGGNNRQQHNCNNNQCCSLIRFLKQRYPVLGNRLWFISLIKLALLYHFITSVSTRNEIKLCIKMRTRRASVREREKINDIGLILLQIYALVQMEIRQGGR